VYELNGVLHFVLSCIWKGDAEKKCGPDLAALLVAPLSRTQAGGGFWSTDHGEILDRNPFPLGTRISA
jgi:hypothetical protein